MSEELTIIPQELEKAVAETHLAIESAQSLRDSFAPHFIQFHKLAAEAQSIAINAPKAAREMRLKIRAVRIAAEKTRKELKEDLLRKGKAIDGINALLEYQLVPVEERMDKIEKAEEIAAAERKAALKAEREKLLSPYVSDVALFNLAEMTPDAFASLLEGQKTAFIARKEAEAKAEAERIKKEKEAAEERERIRVENEKLKREAAEREAEQRKERERLKALADAAIKAAAKEREALEAKAEAERQKAAAERAEIEKKAKAERELAAAAAAKEREAREKLENEIRQKAAAEEAKVVAEKLAAKKAAAAPDKQKLTELASSVRSLRVPQLTNTIIAEKISSQVSKFAAWIEAEADKL